VSDYVVHVSAGTGPEEVRRFVAALARWLEGRCEVLGLPVQAVLTHGDPEAPGSVELWVSGDAPSRLRHECGTHALVAEGARRANGRKRFFAGVSVMPAEPEGEPVALDARDLVITAERAGGPGGQHVNKVSTAVRVLHRPSGITVRVAEERSQSANVRAAVARIAARLSAQAREAKAAGRAARRMANYRFERGNPVRVFRLSKRRDGIEPVSEGEVRRGDDAE
jgi:peptide chain release factor 2/peptide chain release factor